MANVLVQLRYNEDTGQLEATSGSPAWTAITLNNPVTEALTSGHIFVGNSSNVSTDVAMSGDATMANTGAVTIANLAVTAGKIATATITDTQISASAAIAVSKLAAVTASKVLVSDASGFVSASSVTTTTLGYLDATSSIQTQLNTKVDTAGRGLAKTSTTLAVTPSTQTATASGGNVTPTSDTKDTVIITVDANFTVLAPSGTPVSGQKLLFRLDNDGTHAATFDTGGAGKFRFGTTIASYTATASKSDYIGAVYNSTASRWDIVSASLGF